MALYNQAPMGYVQQPAYPPQQQQTYFTQQYDPYDQASFRQFYRMQLRALTFNSRPVIQYLSQLAIDNMARMAPVVAECIEEYIRYAPPAIKLPSFYLLDSIAKNCFPYARHFAPFIRDLFLSSNYEVDGQTKQKMHEMLVTWRTGGPNGSCLFGEGNQAAIEREIWPGSEDVYGGNGRGRSYPTQSQVLTELEVVLALKEKAAVDNPYDRNVVSQIDALYQLRNMVQSSNVTADELGAILIKLRELARTVTPMVPLPPPPAPVTNRASYSYPPPGPPAPPQSHYASPTPPPIAQPTPVSFQPPSQAQPHPQAPASAAIPDLSNLFKSLVAAGLVPVNNANAAPKIESAIPKLEPESSKENTPVAPDLDDILEYERRVLAFDVQLTSADLMKERPEVVSLLYDRQTTQCKQCGLRFHDNVKGKKLYQDHLDQHFRQNSRANQQAGRGYSRSWFISTEDWINDGSEDSAADGPRSHRATGAKETAAQKRKELEQSYVVIPPGEDTKPKFCPICKEALKSEFLEDEEEWVWRNAVEHKSTIYHATCHADALSATLASRLRSEMRGSRGGTPERGSTPLPAIKSEDSGVTTPLTESAALAGSKRKAENADEIHVKTEEDVEPPAKRSKPSP